MTRLVERFYLYYFTFMSRYLGRTREYVFVDIDNTVNVQTARLSKFVTGNQCDYRSANRFGQLIRDLPVDGASAFVNSLTRHSSVIWLTSRSLKQLPGTLVWLVKNGFPVCAVVCTGSTVRKTKFLEVFLRQHRVRFIIDDMKEGYEFGSPRYIVPYKNFLENNSIRVYEDLPARGLKNGKLDSYVESMFV